MRQVRDVDRSARTLSVDPPIEVGTTVQFLGEDAAGADQDLREQLAGPSRGGALALRDRRAAAGLFAEPDHDAELVSTIVDGEALVGPVCAAVVTSFGPAPPSTTVPTAVVVWSTRATRSPDGARTPPDRPTRARRARQLRSRHLIAKRSER